MNDRFRYVSDGHVWEITKISLPFKHQLSMHDAHSEENYEEEMRYEEGRKFMAKLHEFLAPHMSRSDQAVLLEALVKSIKETYVDMIYTEQYLRPISDALVKFLDAEKAKPKGE
jgi:hypothetical protein